MTDEADSRRGAWRRHGERALGLAAVIGIAGTAQAVPLSYRLDPEHTHVHWELQHFGTSTSRGRFDAISGSVTLDREGHGGSASISIDTASINTGTPIFNGVLRGPLLLDSAAQPQAYFVASRFGFDGDRLVSVAGEFTLRGIGRPLTLRALQFGCRNDAATNTTPAREVCGGDFEGEIVRSEFGITHSLPFVGDRVRLLIQIEATR